ncbi:MAG: hypothetical protein M1561_06720 [Gammaproteobacteria bacterium]|nr:hypothetical protein [Gammaproteobacteria bacterium]
MSTGPAKSESFSEIARAVLSALADRLAKGFDPMKNTAQEKTKEILENHPMLTTIISSVSDTIAKSEEMRRLAEEARKVARGERPGLTAEETKAMNDALRNQPK